MSNRPVDDTSKPSRLNRRRKKKWKITALALTAWAFETILLLPFKKRTVGIATPFLTGLKMTATLAVFFRLSFRAALVRLSSMAALFGQPNGWPFQLTVVASHLTPSPKSLQPFRGGLSLFNWIIAMNTHSTGPNCAQKPTPVFTIVLYRRVIAIGVSFQVALRFKKFYPASQIKFAGFGGAA